MKTCTTFILMSILLMVSGLAGTGYAEEAFNILFIGNSFTFQGPIPDLVKNIASDAGYAVPIVKNVSVGGKSLGFHRNNQNTLDAIDQAGWDYVVLQEYSTKATDNAGDPAGFKVDATFLYDRIKKSSPKAHVILYQTWARHEKHSFYKDTFKSRDQMQTQIIKHYRDCANNYIPTHSMSFDKTDVQVAPVGQAWDMNYHGRNLLLHAEDLYHAGNTGQYLNAMVIYATIYQRSVEGLASQLGVSPKDAAYLQGICDSVTGKAMESEIDELLGQMTLAEKVKLLNGDESGFNAQGLERLGIPRIRTADGPVGVRGSEATAFPSSVNLAASWDVNLARRYGQMLAEETKAKGKHVILGPCICIHRFPLSGRNFENYGEDPFLTSRIAVSYIEGVQGQGVIATAKHFAVNDQEWERHNVDVLVDERALREIHLPAFEYAVKEADVYAVMCAYNVINGHHASENKHLLSEILKDEWGFDGVLMSDWRSVYSTVEAANHGLDLEMPHAKWFGEKLLEAVKAGRVSEATINDKVRRLLRVRFKGEIFKNPDLKENPQVIRSDLHREFALEAAQKSMVLLKNKGVLPLGQASLQKIAVIGPNAKIARTGGGGSSLVKPWRVVTPYDGIVNGVEGHVEVCFAVGTDDELGFMKPIPSQCLRVGGSQNNGLQGEYYNNTSFQGKPDLVRLDKEIDFSYEKNTPAEGINCDNFSVCWTGTLIPRESGRHVLGIASDDGSKLYLDDKIVIDNSGNHAETLKTCEMKFIANKPYSIRLEYSEATGDAAMKLVWIEPGMFTLIKDKKLTEAIALAKESDVAIVCVGNNAKQEQESIDLPSFKMAGEQDRIVQAIAAVNPRTIVVLSGGTPVDTSAWLGDVEGLILAMYPGQEGGQALADILFGRVNPSGKLPFSYIQSRSETYAFDGYQDPSLKMPYHEGVFVGYRYYDTKGIDPLYEFGYGLSYTTFEYSGLEIEKIGTLDYLVSATIKNTGGKAGAEIVQLYISPPESKVQRPVKELKAFAKVSLEAGESKMIHMTLNPRSFQYYDVQAKDWAFDAGRYEILLGASSRDIRQRKEIEIQQTY